jgi:GNAT superfamily N-acetyltransferase
MTVRPAADPSPRRATADDVPALVHLVNRAFRVEAFFVDGDRTHEADVRSKLATPQGCFLVLDGPAPGQLAAAVYTEIRGARGYFGMLAVDPGQQKRGLGRLLVAAVEDHCRAAGCRFLDLDVVNLRPELPVIYRALGFAPFDTAPFPDNFRVRRPVHLVVMTKPLVALTEGDAPPAPSPPAP